MSDPTARSGLDTPRPGARDDSLLRVGVCLFAVGSLAALVALVPFLLGGDPFPTWVYLLSVLSPLGLGLVLWALWRTARHNGRRARADSLGSP